MDCGLPSVRPAVGAGGQAGGGDPGLDGGWEPEGAAAGGGEVGRGEVAGAVPGADGLFGDAEEGGDVGAAVDAVGDSLDPDGEGPVGFGGGGDPSLADVRCLGNLGDGLSGAAGGGPGPYLLRGGCAGFGVGGGVAGCLADRLVGDVVAAGDVDDADAPAAQRDPAATPRLESLGGA